MESAHVSFITVKNGVVTGYHSGSLDADYFGQPFYGHERIVIPNDNFVTAGDLVDYYDKDWNRKSDLQLINEGLMDMPAGYVVEGGTLRKLTEDEQIAAGLIPPPEGMKVEDGKIVPMTLEDQRGAGLITEEEYLAAQAGRSQRELNGRLAELNSEEAKARSEVDADYAAERKSKMTALLAVKKQDGWPVNVIWPE
jgi:hypothetical protein